MRILHLHSSFDRGGKELRAARLMNAFGRGIAHHVVSAVPGALAAASAIEWGIDVAYPDDFPSLSGRPTPARLQRLATAMRGYDLVLTYNWGAMDAVMAQTVFRDFLKLPPLVHHEDGFNEDEAAGLKTSRNWYRRLALGRASALVVPSRLLETVALGAWQQPRGRVHLIPNGIALGAYARKPKADALPRIVKRPGELWVGTLAGLRTVKNLPRLVRAFAGLPPAWQLVILGDGPERDAIKAQALASGVADRVHLPGFAPDPGKAVGLFDVFALSSDSEQFPISVVEAMAVGLPVASPAVGDVAQMVSPENRPLICAPGSDGALAEVLARLAGDAALRASVGTANRAHALAHYDEAAMIASYRSVYARAMGLAQFPPSSRS
ncbi:glycosyltransferase involved in cell wall biosynthesis [Novosphingobium chloroacetimidivorans]|uniref:Glycosyltransferase involved in cell wall biosynthesis n=1 Tax=Novosphingobium chloroacetimidivorans TaxID=1428314 RepID=A0A7W7K8L4_9SPHN|nr:glycosyltransferase family 4 protein [Novosphingobium chloroacetimidivorans]MBB4857523.1 glycosyltransferase involved in cell wall biosynthesis [Novosphingobium chloroacetimidivorans]